MEKALSEQLCTIDSLSTSKPIPVPPRDVPPFEGTSHAVDAHSPTGASLRASASSSSFAVSPSFFNPSPLKFCDSALSADGRLRPLPALKIV